MQRLKSLKGIENLKKFREQNGEFELEIYGCPRLTDLSALEGKKLRRLKLAGTYILPDLGSFRTLDLELDSVEGLEDLSCLEALDPEKRINLTVLMPDEITNLMTARNLKGDRLVVSPQFTEQAQGLVEEGHYREIEIRYPDRSWQQNDSGFTLLSLEEIDELPKVVLGKVETLILAGDTVVNMETHEARQEWDEMNNRNKWVIQERGTDMITDVQTGTLTDLTRLVKLTKLKWLWVVCQPLQNVNGVEDMLQLEEADFQDCDQLTDISGLFTVESLRRIDIRNAPVSSIQGIQNLPALTSLNLNNTRVTDIAPLAECDLGAAEQEGGLNLTIQGSEPVRDLTPLEGIRSFGMMFMNEQDAETWLPHMQGARVRDLNINQMNGTIFGLLEGISVENLNYQSFALKNLEEIDSLPSEITEKITRICLIGDQLYEENGQIHLEEDWKGNKAIPVIQNWQTQERTQVEMGTGVDLSNLAKLPNLEELTLAVQPMADLEALRGLHGLRKLNVSYCTKLTDISAVADLTELEDLDLNRDTGVKDLGPITGLKKLRRLEMNGIQAKDWTVLEGTDFSYSDRNGGFSLGIDNCNKKMTFLAGIKNFSFLGLGGIKADLWLEYVAGAKIYGIWTGNMNQKQLEQFLDQHPEIEQLNIPNCKAINDLTKLLSMPNLKQVTITQDMKKAIQSLDGAQYGFQMAVW